MIVSTTPLRISFFGGGSDIRSYYAKHGGVVLSTAIDKSIWIASNFCEPKHVRVVYSQAEVVDDVNALKHDRVREALKAFNVRSNFEMCSFSDVSTKGTGLGSSSTFTVGMVSALSALSKKHLSVGHVAELACEIEIDKCGEPIGKQDQYAAAYGGFNMIEFDKDGSVEVTPMNKLTPTYTLLELNDNLICFNTNKTRNASSILQEQVAHLVAGSNVEGTQQLVSMAREAVYLLKKDKLEDFGSLLHESWQVKKSLSSGISDPDIDEMYELGLKSGALGGKLLGAGGGGYMLFYVPFGRRHKLREAMLKAGYDQFSFKFNYSGTRTTAV